MCGKNFMLSSLTDYYTVILDHTLKENQMVSVQDSVILARGDVARLSKNVSPKVEQYPKITRYQSCA